jgi:hypothetical protein
MKVALGFKSHSGWAAMVAIGTTADGLSVIDRRRIELIEAGELWAKQPYHAAEELEPVNARDVVSQGVESARKVAVQRMHEAIAHIRSLKHEVAACAVLMPQPMPDWSTAEILAVHFRMHKAEGVLFPDALCRAAKACKLQLAAIPEKTLADDAERILKTPFSSTMEKIAEMGRSIGPPWGKDQKTAALAGMIALQEKFK